MGGISCGFPHTVAKRRKLVSPARQCWESDEPQTESRRDGTPLLALRDPPIFNFPQMIF